MYDCCRKFCIDHKHNIEGKLGFISILWTFEIFQHLYVLEKDFFQIFETILSISPYKYVQHSKEMVMVFMRFFFVIFLAFFDFFVNCRSPNPKTKCFLINRPTFDLLVKKNLHRNYYHCRLGIIDKIKCMLVWLDEWLNVWM